MSLKGLSYREVEQHLKAAGFIQITQKGSHVKFAKLGDNGMLTAIVPKHREIAVGTLRSILRQANLSVEEFQKLKQKRPK